MYTYEMLTDLNNLKLQTSILEDADLAPTKDELLTNDEKNKLNNVSVPVLSDEKYRKSSDEKMIGASGNKPVEDKTKDGYPQMELGGLNINLKKELGRTESFDGPIDEEPMETATDKKQENVIEKVTNLFNEMYGKTYQEESKEKNKKFTYDFTQPSIILNKDSGFKIKRGW